MVWLGQVSLAPPPAPTESEPGGLGRVASIILALIAFAVLLTPFGFKLVDAGVAPGPLLRLRSGARAREDRGGRRRQRGHALRVRALPAGPVAGRVAPRAPVARDSRDPPERDGPDGVPLGRRRVPRRVRHAGAHVDRGDRRLGPSRQPRRRHGPPARQVRLPRTRCGRSTAQRLPWPACRPSRRSPSCPAFRTSSCWPCRPRRCSTPSGIAPGRASATASPTRAGSRRRAGRAPSSSARSSPCAARPGSRSAARTASGSSTRRRPPPRRSRPRSPRWTRCGPGAISMVSQSGGIGTNGVLARSSRPASASATWSAAATRRLSASPTTSTRFAQDEGTRVIAAYLEGSADTRKLVRALEEARDRRKPVVLIKAGATSASARAAQAHTGALVGEDRVFDAVLQEMGVIRVDSVEELLDVALMLVGTRGQDAGRPGRRHRHVRRRQRRARGRPMRAVRARHARAPRRSASSGCARCSSPWRRRPTRSISRRPRLSARSPSRSCRRPSTRSPPSRRSIRLCSSSARSPPRAREISDVIAGFWHRSEKPVCVCWPSPPHGIPERLAEHGIHTFLEPARGLRALAPARGARRRPSPASASRAIARVCRHSIGRRSCPSRAGRRRPGTSLPRILQRRGSARRRPASSRSDEDAAVARGRGRSGCRSC